MKTPEYISDNKLHKLLEFNNKRYYYNHKIISKNKILHILDNRNIKTRYKVKKAIIINRCNGKYLPSNIILYNNIEDNYFDRNQATELNIGTLIHIIHISKDNKWYFIKTYNYYCWVYYKNIVTINTLLFNKYLNSKNFIITIDKIYTSSNKYLDMGVKLPIYKELETSTIVILPSKKNNKYYEEKLTIDNKYINKGYLNYNKHNLLLQAYKYLNTPYGWGGINNGIDCSGLIVNIYKTFGIYLPRDTNKQKQIIGTTIYNTDNYTYQEKLNILNKLNTPGIIYTNGHVMLMINNNQVIHASSTYMKVIISNINNEIINNIKSIHIIEFDKIS